MSGDVKKLFVRHMVTDVVTVAESLLKTIRDPALSYASLQNLTSVEPFERRYLDLCRRYVIRCPAASELRQIGESVLVTFNGIRENALKDKGLTDDVSNTIGDNALADLPQGISRHSRALALRHDIDENLVFGRGKRGHWTEEEENALLKVHRAGQSWVLTSTILETQYGVHRDDRQCREKVRNLLKGGANLTSDGRIYPAVPYNARSRKSRS